jgi:hypothetical protein
MKKTAKAAGGLGPICPESLANQALLVLESKELFDSSSRLKFEQGVVKNPKNSEEPPVVRAAHPWNLLLGWCWWTLAVGLLCVGLGWANDAEAASQATQSTAAGSENSKDPGDESPSPKPRAPSLNPENLEDVKDGRPVPEADETDLSGEIKAYFDAMIQAKSTAPEVLADSARRDLTFAHLFEEPWKYRGEVVHFEGQLTRIRRFDPPRFFKGGAYGIDNLYEGWIFSVDTNYVNPLVAMFTELPPGLTVKEKTDKMVSLDGYFFKKFRYKDGEGKTRDAPLLIGRTVRLLKTPPAIGSVASFSKVLGTAFLGVLAVLVILTVALTWWYRKGDRRIHSVLAAAKPAVFTEPEPVFPEQPEPKAEPLAEDWPVQPHNRLENFPQ